MAAKGIFCNSVDFCGGARSPLSVGRVDFTLTASDYSISENAING